MKFKKEYRWLLFLIIPFIVFMIILFMVPLEIVISSQPLATRTYNLRKIENQEILQRSLSYNFQHALLPLSESLSSYFQLFHVQNSQLFLQTNENQIKINNANKYYEASSASGVEYEYQSMWFAKNISNLSSFTSQQSNMYSLYLRKQLYLRSLLKSGNADSIAGVYNFYAIGGNSQDNLAFYFPSYPENAYSALNSSVDSSVYESLLGNYKASGNVFMVFNGTSRPKLAQAIVSLCQLQLNITQPVGVTCVDVASHQFSSRIAEMYQALDGNLNLHSYLTSPTYSTTTALMAMNITSSTSSSTQQNSLFSDLSSVAALSSNSFISIFRISGRYYYIYPLSLLGNELDQIMGYFVIQSQVTSGGADLLSSDVLGTSLNTLIIPTVILIFISLVISVVVLRTLMTGLDLELHKLNECCKFIFDGDLQIEIPEYKGTKDILQIYQQIKIINKLNRYSNKDYFVGHFSNRIFKYNEALQVINKLNYNPSNLMENIGEAYLYIEEFDKSIHFLKQSVKIIEKEIEEEFGGLDKMVMWKQEKEKLPNLYKEKELILIRKLFKLVFTLFKYVQLQLINSKQLDQQNITEQEKVQKKQKLQQETAEYITKLKKAIYPDFKSYAESCMLLNFEIKFLMSTKNFETARDCLSRCTRVTQIYSKEYDEVTKRLKEKGSKNLFFFKKNKLTGHSRSNPNTMQAFNNYTKALFLIADPKEKDYNQAFHLVSEGLKKNVMSQSVNYFNVNEIKKLIQTFKLSLDKFETTQLFRQSMPYKMLHYGPLSKEVEATMYRIAKNAAEVQSREYVLALDASYYYSSSKQFTDQIKYLHEKSQYLYDKLIKKYDRLSLIRSNSEINLETICSLILKESNEVVLKKNLLDMMNYNKFAGKNELVSSLERIMSRIKHLQCEKVVVVFLKYIQSYLDERIYRGRAKTKSKTKKIKETMKCLPNESEKRFLLEDIGEGIEQIMTTEGLRNCKLLLVCAFNDDYDRLIKTFGLTDINRRIWKQTDGYNKHNNVVYVIDQKHKSDLDRILMSKIANVSDNHVFAL